MLHGLDIKIAALSLNPPTELTPTSRRRYYQLDTSYLVSLDFVAGTSDNELVREPVVLPQIATRRCRRTCNIARAVLVIISSRTIDATLSRFASLQSPEGGASKVSVDMRYQIRVFIMAPYEQVSSASARMVVVYKVVIRRFVTS